MGHVCLREEFVLVVANVVWDREKVVVVTWVRVRERRDSSHIKLTSHHTCCGVVQHHWRYFHHYFIFKNTAWDFDHFRMFDIGVLFFYLFFFIISFYNLSFYYLLIYYLLFYYLENDNKLKGWFGRKPIFMICLNR